ncbi:MAG: hypothetical protein WEA82_09975 [Idiomarina sp.]
MMTVSKRISTYFWQNVISCCLAISVILGSVIYLWFFKSVGIFPVVDLSTGWLLLGTASLSAFAIIFLLFTVIHLPSVFADISEIQDDDGLSLTETPKKNVNNNEQTKNNKTKESDKPKVSSLIALFGLPPLLGTSLVVTPIIYGWWWTLIFAATLAINFLWIYVKISHSKYSKFKFLAFILMNTIFTSFYLFVCAIMTYSVLTELGSMSELQTLLFSLFLTIIVAITPFLSLLKYSHDKQASMRSRLVLSSFMTLVLFTLIFSGLPDKILGWYKLGTIENVHVMLDKKSCARLDQMPLLYDSFDSHSCTLKSVKILTRLGSEIHIVFGNGHNLVLDKKSILGWIEYKGV